MHTRRVFLRAAPAICLTPAFVAGATLRPARNGPYPCGVFPQQDAELVKSIVGQSHRSLEAVAALLERRPELANASWDWGFGDWESALGAASHTGRREIALLLMEYGARPDVFTFAMLGHVDAVRAITEAQPAQRRCKGPHGITLMAHARAGGKHAAAVVEYLSRFEDADQAQGGPPLPSDQQAVYVGAYAADDGTGFEIKVVRDMLAFLFADAPRTLFHVGEDTFHPTGAPSVRLVFAVSSGRAESVEITAPEPLLNAIRSA